MPKTQGAPTQVVRAVTILRRLQGRFQGVRLDDLVDELGVSRSQIRRDLLALEEAGINLAFDKEEGRYGRARVRIVDADNTSVPITRRERQALLAARRLFDIFRGTPFHEDIESIYEKLIDTLPARDRKDLRTLAQQILYIPTGGTKHYSDDTKEVIDALQTGIMQRRLINYAYKPRFGAASTGTLAPHAFVFFRNGLYTVASRLKEDQHQPPRVFAVERFQHAQPIRKTRFQPPADLDIETLFDGAFDIITGSKTHHVIVELSRAARPEALTRVWHKTQRVTELPGGRVRVEFDLTSLREIVPWILEWGTEAVAIAPVELRRRVRRALHDSAGHYE